MEKLVTKQSFQLVFDAQCPRNCTRHRPSTTSGNNERLLRSSERL